MNKKNEHLIQLLINDDEDDDYSEDSEDRFEAMLRGRRRNSLGGRRDSGRSRWLSERERRVQEYKEERHPLADDPFE